jgi:hypothetical protein
MDASASTSIAPSEWFKVICSLLIGITIALVSAYMTVRLAFRRFHSEKKWEQKTDAYKRIFIALHQLKEQASHELDLQRTPDRLPKGSEAEVQRREVLKRLGEEMNLGIAELRLQFDIGTFIIDENAVVLLENLMVGLDESVDVWRKSQVLTDYYEHRIKAVTECQSGLRKIANRDLSQSWK